MISVCGSKMKANFRETCTQMTPFIAVSFVRITFYETQDSYDESAKIHKKTSVAFVLLGLHQT